MISAKPPILIDFVDFPFLEKSGNPLLPILEARYQLVHSDWPDFLFFTHEGQRHRLYSCTKIFYTQECYRPNWNQCDYALLSIKLDDPRAFHLPYYSLWSKARDLIRDGSEDYRALLQSKTGFFIFLTWYADRSVLRRSEFFRKLNARKGVDSAGKVLNNTGWRVPPGIPAKREHLRRYKFHIAFENRDIPGWTTEKFTDAFASFTVPIFWGDVTVKEQFNKDAFIDRRDFESDEACINHILKVDADDELYLKYLSASPFYGNKPNKEWDHERLLKFLDDVFSAPPKPVAQRRWFWPLTKWRLIKRVKTHRERGMPTAYDRYEARIAKRKLYSPEATTR